MLSVLLQQLLYAAPILIVYAIALILGIVNLNRAPRAAWLAIGASLILIVSHLMFLAIRVYLFSDPNRNSGIAFGQTLQIVGLADMLIDVVGTLVLVIAIFVDRRAATSTYAAAGANPFGSKLPPGFPPPPAR
jgi:hypothetical protein